MYTKVRSMFLSMCVHVHVDTLSTYCTLKGCIDSFSISVSVVSSLLNFCNSVNTDCVQYLYSAVSPQCNFCFSYLAYVSRQSAVMVLNTWYHVVSQNASQQLELISTYPDVVSTCT